MTASDLLSDGRLLVILNPAAGRGAGRNTEASLHRAAARLNLVLEVRATAGAGDARSLACAAAAEDRPLVAVAGGDGTLGEVAAGLAGSSTVMALLPTGTGNDLARHLGIPRRPAAALEELPSFEVRPLDLGDANGTPFVLAVGAGFDATVAQEVNQGRSWVRGSLAYVVALARTLSRYHPTRMTISVDGQEDQFQAYFVVVANARGYGGGMKIAPAASVEDGLLDVCAVKAVPKLELLRAAATVYRGRHITHPAVRMYRGRQIRVASDPPVLLTVDGELRGTTPLNVTVLPAALRVLVPPALPRQPRPLRRCTCNVHRILGWVRRSR